MISFKLSIVCVLLTCFTIVSARTQCKTYKRPMTGKISSAREGFFNCWGVDVENGQSELIILLDTSGSMRFSGLHHNGRYMDGFEVAKDFIKALLAEVRVSFNSTRIAIGTFSTTHQIKFNYILNPGYSNTKCKFNEDFKQVRFDGGMTHLKGALNDALSVFQQLYSNPIKHQQRDRSNKVVILLTDGAGNMVGNRVDYSGRDATPEALRLRQSGNVEVYTVAVTKDADKDMMEKIATDPSLFLYANDFTDLAALAHNIRGDPYEKDYETHSVDSSHCGDCDRNALCGCNLKSGNYRCVCHRGYYGTGEYDAGRVTCFQCPKNTYGDKRGYLTDCQHCPENSETIDNGRPALSKSDCICKKGYTGVPGKDLPCTPTPCRPAPDINFGGFFDSATCVQATYDIKCQYECRPSYKMVTSNDFITCTETGAWTSPTPRCELISCVGHWESTGAMSTFTAQCNTTKIDHIKRTYPASTECSFTCDHGYYQHSGASRIRCLASGDWNESPLDCRASECPRVPQLTNVIAVQNPELNCFDKILKVGDQCKFYCPSGYSLKGLAVLECLATNTPIGKWNVDTSKNENIPTCIDVEKPNFADEFRCNSGINIVKQTLPGKNYAEIDFEFINVTDNSGKIPTVTCWKGTTPCQYEMGQKYQFEITAAIDITFKATDDANNAAKCLFRVTIEDKEPPKVVFCPDNIIEKTTDNSKVIRWEEPTFTDNCGIYPVCDIRVTSNIPNGQPFSVNSPVTVSYTARDESNNVNEECRFDVKVEVTGCPNVEPPRNGLVVKNPYILSVFCVKGYYHQSSNLYFCAGGNWVNGEFPIPDCIAKDPPDGVSQEGIGNFQYEGDCDQTAVQKNVKDEFLKNVPVPDTVTVGNLEVYCGSTTLLHRRRKRSLRGMTIKFRLLLKGSKEEARENPNKNFKDLQDKLDSKYTPEFLNALKKFPSWRNLNKYLARLDDVNKHGASVSTCTSIGDEENTNEKNIALKCIVCGAGNYKNLTTGKCEKCPSGQYQPRSGQTACLKCPHGTVIVGSDTKNYTSCKTVCQPGEYSPNGLAPCYKCEAGYYSDQTKSIKCVKCPDSTTSLGAGTASKFECGSLCPPGTYSENGVEPCVPCKKGYYQPKSGSDKCYSCPDLMSTPGKGAAKASSCQEINDCVSQPCMNSGHCVDLKDDYRCECKDGYWGKNCELEVDNCQFSPCINNGTCLNKYRSYHCMCETGTYGDNCNQILKTCSSNPCSAHGKCLDAAENKVKCVCDNFYTGEFCETRVDPCASNPCHNDAECILSQDMQSYQCLCKNGFQGETCEVKINNCYSNPCKNNATCVDQLYGYACMCKPGYEGLQCHIQTNMCNYLKCHNGGDCESLVNDVKCKCGPGFYGKQCDSKGSADFDLSFQSRVSPSFASVHGRLDLYAFTIAFWMRTSDRENAGTPLSYAVKTNGQVDDNALVLTDYSNFNLFINNETQSLEFDANDGDWHHVAVTWNNRNGLWIVYLDGNKLSSATVPMQLGKYIPKGGVFVIGEEQDSMGGDFTPGESFYGDLSQLNVWNRELAADEIYDLAFSCFHESGNVISWSDFSSQNTGRVLKTTPSLACDFNNNLRDYQYLKDRTLPTLRLETKPNLKLTGMTPEKCAEECNARMEWCRSFVFTKSTSVCNLLPVSVLVDDSITTIFKDGIDHYILSCIKSLGMSSGRISNAQITSNSVDNNAYAHLARLDNTPKSAADITYWKPNLSSGAYIEVNFNEKVRITGIATQGHPNQDINEFVSSYNLHYQLENGGWISYNKNQLFSGNSASGVQTVRQEVHFQTTKLRLYPFAGSGSNRVALRMEVYGCPLKPQGTPSQRPDKNHCLNSPCKNGGTCFDLYQRYKCVCSQGFSGNQCEVADNCKAGDIDTPLHGYLQFSPANQATYISATPHCNVGYALQTLNRNVYKCSTGEWIHVMSSKCVDVNECEQNVCSHGCENLIGSYRCTCPRGKYLGTDKNTCIGKDECKAGTARCENKCIHTDGGFKCACPDGYHVPFLRMCFDINECETGSHKCEQTCENTLGSYKCKCKPGYRLNTDGKSCTFITCGTLSSIPRGNVAMHGDTATYTCDLPYKLDGSKVRSCLADGTWSGVEPTCNRVIQCVPILSPPENGRIAVNQGNSYDSIVTFQCNAGYTLIGTASIRCDSNSRWSAEVPQCVFSLCHPYSVVNGKMLGYSKTVGSVSRVQCNKGYRLSTPQYEFRRCEANAQWTGGSNQMICDIVDCGAVENLGGVQVTYISGTKYNAIARYSCRANECLEGNTIRRCQADGKWSGEPPTCKQNSCCSPPIPQHSTLFSDGIYTPGRSAYVRCDTGYITGGDEFRECLHGTPRPYWDGKDTTCTIVDCGDPGTLDNGMRQGHVYTYQAKLKFICQPGYIIEGSRERICQGDGRWSGTQPKCTLGKNGGHVNSRAGSLRCYGGEVCHWLLEVTQGKKVSIEFKTFTFGVGDKCEVYDGQSWEPFVVFTEDAKPLPITANGHFMRIITNGFVSITFSEQTCGGLLSEPNGVITSPNFPIDYPPNLDCYWTIHRPYNRVQLRFTRFLLQANKYDYVTVREGPFNHTDILLYNRYGAGVPWLLRDWADRWYWMHFHTDVAFSNKGFQALYGNYEPRV